jgi:hypothetical protein
MIDGPGKIPIDLISGHLPAVHQTESRWALGYVPLIRGPDDGRKPELIRVLIVHPGSPEQPLQCSIEVVMLPRLEVERNIKKKDEVDRIVEAYRSFGREHQYTALSYSWGEQRPSEPIQIIQRDSTEILSLPVTKNLKDALVQLRHVSEKRTFWADAICMNQNDRAEKSQQLPLMPRIYGEAKNVCVWLGVEGSDQHANRAFGLIQKIRKWKDYEKVVEEKTTCEEWDSFIALMKQGWFQRRWIIQEIVLAGVDQADIWWGSMRIPWIEFAQAVSIFEDELRDRVKKLFRLNPKYANRPDMFGEVREFNASTLVKVTANIVSRRDDGRVVRKRETLESLISTLTSFISGQAHDAVYAILSLAKDAAAGPPTVDLKMELKFEDMPPSLIQGCNIHSPSSMVWKLILALLPGGLTYLARWLFQRYPHLVSEAYAKLPQVHGLHSNIYFRTAVTLAVLSTVLMAVVFCISIAHGLLFRLYRRILYMLPLNVAIRFFSATVDRNGEKTILPLETCQCTRKLRILNSAMRRLKHRRFPVDYEKGFADVCEDLYIFATHQSLSLDLIFRPWCPIPPRITVLSNGKRKWLPTWVRSLEDGRAYKPSEDGNSMKRVNADTLVGLPGASPYQASGLYRTGWRFVRDGETQILRAHGFQLDVISEVSDAAENGSIPRSWLKEYKRSTESGSNEVSSQFWRTMVAGKGPNGQHLPLSYSLLAEDFFKTDDGLNLMVERHDTTNPMLKSFLDHVMSVIWNRRLARTTKLGQLALLPYATEPRDIICILYGCSVPVVLRKMEDEKTSSGEELWELIGECYVYDMMAGEALAEKRRRIDGEKDFYSDRDFNIR